MSRTMRLMLIHQAERALRYWAGDGISREKAAEELPNWHAFEGLDDEMVADVLSRFPAAEPPSVPGLDWLPGGIITADAKAIVDQVFAGELGAVVTAAKVNAAAEAVAVLDEPKARPIAATDTLAACLVCNDTIRKTARTVSGWEHTGDAIVLTHDAEPAPCCDDHGNICGVVEHVYAACCDDCPEFAGAVTP